MASYEQRGKGKLWSVRFYEYGKLIRLTGFKTKKDAQHAYEKRSVERLDPKQNIEKKEDDTLVTDIVYSYLEYAKHSMKESSYVVTEGRVRTHVLPDFDGVKLSELTPRLIMRWQQNLISQGLSIKYVESIRTAFVAAWNYAATWGLFHHSQKQGETPTFTTKSVVFVGVFLCIMHQTLVEWSYFGHMTCGHSCDQPSTWFLMCARSKPLSK